MDYSENFCGIRYSAKRGETLEIRASAEDFNLNCWDGVLNLMSNDAIGRTALFAEDCDFYQDSKEWLIKAPDHCMDCTRPMGPNVELTGAGTASG